MWFNSEWKTCQWVRNLWKLMIRIIMRVHFLGGLALVNGKINPPGPKSSLVFIPVNHRSRWFSLISFFLRLTLICRGVWSEFNPQTPRDPVTRGSLWPFQKPLRTSEGPLTPPGGGGDLLREEVCRRVREGRFIEPETWHLSQIFTVRGLRRSPRAKTWCGTFYPVLLNMCGTN